MENGEQKIFVWCDFSEQMGDAIIHGLQIALILRKELCLLNVLGSGRREDKKVVEERLTQVAGKIIGNVSHINIHYLVSERPLNHILTELAEDYDALLLTAPKKSASFLLKILPESGFPFLFVSGKTNVEDYYQKIVVPVGYMKRCKDSALWASYISRNNYAAVDLFKSEEVGEADNVNVKKNLYSIEGLFSKFGFQYNVIESKTPTWKLSKAAFNHVNGYSYSTLILASNNRPSIIDNLLGLSEKKLIKNSGRIPVMCINSKRDLYTLCG